MLLSLHVKLIPGADIGQAFLEACALAVELELAWVTFDFNGMHCVAYPRGYGFALNDSRKAGEWTDENGFTWKESP
jgi:hypothetical protein